MGGILRARMQICRPLLATIRVSACTTVTWDYPRPPSSAWPHPEATGVGRLFQEAADRHPGLSGFSLFPQGADARTLDPHAGLVWMAETNGVVRRYDVDPETTLWQRSVIGFVRLLPIEGQL